MDIVIVSQYIGNLDKLDTTNGRFGYLGGLLSVSNDVEIITSTYIHHLKKQAEKGTGEYNNCKITQIFEPGYKKNVSLKRIISHHQLANNILGYLEKRKKPDLVYVAVPPLSVAESVAEYCRKNKVRFLIDIQDLWPEAFKMILNVPPITNIIYKPFENQANRVYRQADEIIAVSRSYAKRAVRKNKKCHNKALVVYLGTDKRLFDNYSNQYQPSNEKFKIAYVGSLSHSYDIRCVIDAISLLRGKDIQFVVMGDGELKNDFEKYAHKKEVDIVFTGRLEYKQMIVKLTQCQIAVNPIRKGSAGSIINKVGDYAMAGLPVINTQENLEYRQLIDEYDCGINCTCGNAREVADAIVTLFNEKKRMRMADNSRRLGEDKFDRNVSYKKIVRLIQNNLMYTIEH